MTKAHQKIVNSYIKEGLSSKQIADRLGRGVSGIDYILKKYGVQKRSISEGVIRVNLSKFNKGDFVVKKRLNRQEELLKVAGVMLYWGEGTKGGSSVALANSDPGMVRLFLRFLRQICGVSDSRLRVTMHLYPGLNEGSEKVFWSKITNIPELQFGKAWYHEAGKGSYKRKCLHGTVSVTYSDKRLHEIVKSWILGYSQL